jgi:hypothetical protein
MATAPMLETIARSNLLCQGYNAQDMSSGKNIKFLAGGANEARQERGLHGVLAAARRRLKNGSKQWQTLFPNG